MRWLLLFLALACCGCGKVQYVQSPQQTVTEADSGLKAGVLAALKGHTDVARDYWAIYTALAELVACDQPFRKPADLERTVVQVQKAMGRKHGEVPAFTSIVESHLKPLAENKPLDEASRGDWNKRLLELAAACQAASR